MPYLLSFLWDNGDAPLESTISVSFSISDFPAATELANRARKEVVDAPIQFQLDIEYNISILHLNVIKYSSLD